MTDYTELVKALRFCSHEGVVKCNECKYGGKEWPVGCEEEMMRDAADAIEALQAEVEKWTFNATLEQSKAIANFESYCKLKAQLPKRGEWIDRYDEDDKPFFKRKYVCSACGKWNTYGKSDYCPKCGAKMNDSNASNALNALDNAQDGPIVTPCRGCSDYDGYGGCKSKGGCARAKMEVQDDKR